MKNDDVQNGQGNALGSDFVAPERLRDTSKHPTSSPSGVQILPPAISCLFLVTLDFIWNALGRLLEDQGSIWKRFAHYLKGFVPRIPYTLPPMLFTFAQVFVTV